MARIYLSKCPLAGHAGMTFVCILMSGTLACAYIELPNPVKLSAVSTATETVVRNAHYVATFDRTDDALKSLRQQDESGAIGAALVTADQLSVHVTGMSSPMSSERFTVTRFDLRNTDFYTTIT